MNYGHSGDTTLAGGGGGLAAKGDRLGGSAALALLALMAARLRFEQRPSVGNADPTNAAPKPERGFC